MSPIGDGEHRAGQTLRTTRNGNDARLFAGDERGLRNRPRYLFADRGHLINVAWGCAMRQGKPGRHSGCHMVPIGRSIMSNKTNITTAIALAIVLGASGAAFAYHGKSAEGAVFGGSQTRINDCVHVQFPQCGDTDSTATRD